MKRKKARAEILLYTMPLDILGSSFACGCNAPFWNGIQITRGTIKTKEATAYEDSAGWPLDTVYFLKYRRT